MNKIKEVRLSKKMTQVDLARLCNTSQVNIHYYECGRNPSIELLNCIADVLNVPIRSLVYPMTAKREQIIKFAARANDNDLIELSDFTEYLKWRKQSSCIKTDY